MTQTIINNTGIGFLWFITGILSGALSFLSIKTSMRSLQPGKEALAVLIIAGGGFLRLTLTGFLLFIAIKMNIIYALLMISGFTLARVLMLKTLYQQTGYVENNTNVE